MFCLRPVGDNFVVQLSATVSVLFESSWRQLRRAALRHDKRSILGRIELHVEVLDRLVTCGIHGDLRLVVLPRSSFCQCVHWRAGQDLNQYTMGLTHIAMKQCSAENSDLVYFNLRGWKGYLSSVCSTNQKSSTPAAVPSKLGQLFWRSLCCPCALVLAGLETAVTVASGDLKQNEE